MNIFFSFVILIISWSIDSTDPGVQRLIQFLFIGVHVIIVGVFVFLFYRIWEKGDKRVVESRDSYTREIKKERVWGYDSGKLRELAFTRIMMPAAIGYFVANRFGLPFPLLLQCMQNPVAVYYSKLFQLYVLHREETGELVRPWADEGVVPDWVKDLWAAGEKDSQEMIQNYDNGAYAAAPHSSVANKKKK